MALSTNSPVELAIVVPTYKGKFLGKTLATLAAQTDKRFRVYIGDDCSPDNIEEIVDRWKEKLHISYHRFPSNLGAADLSAHWERCIEITSEPWIWLLGDDDFVDPGCVSSFYSAVQEVGARGLYRFNVQIVDSEDNKVGNLCDFLPSTDAVDFLRLRLSGESSSFLVEYVFKRELYQSVGRFEHFNLAWCSDDALWLKMALQHEIITIAGPVVSWRYSGENLSSMRGGSIGRAKFSAAVAFLNWIYESDYLQQQARHQALKRLARIHGIRWLKFQLHAASPENLFRLSLYALRNLRHGRLAWVVCTARLLPAVVKRLASFSQ